MKCGIYDCSLRDPYPGYCKVSACIRADYLNPGSIQVNIVPVESYKTKLKKNLKDLFMQPGIITEHAVFNVIDRTN